MQKEFDDLGRFSDPSLLILSSLADGPKHGYAMIVDIESFSHIRLEPGTLCAALARRSAPFQPRESSPAIAGYSDALTLAPDAAETYNYRRLVCYRLGDTDRTVADFNHALALSPGYVNALTNRAIARLDKGGYEA